MNQLLLKLTPLLLASLLATACSPSGFSAQLPDDPFDEATSIEGSQDNSSSAVVNTPDLTQIEEPAATLTEEENILSKYAHVDPKHVVPDRHLKAALLYYDKNLKSIKNKTYLTVIDYSQSSTQKRFYMIHMATGEVVSYHVAHGKGSDKNHDGYAEKFSNVEGSNATSLGFFLTAETYNGSNGFSLRLDGLSSTNSNARDRAIVMHGADYVQDKNVVQGRSWGCPALSQANKTKVINLLKGGSLIYSASK